MGIEAPSKEDAVLSPGLSTQPTSSKCWSAFVLSSLASFNTGSVPHTRGTESGNKLEVISPVHRIQGFFFFSSNLPVFFFYFKKIFIYLFLAGLGLHCCADFSLVAGSRGYSTVAVRGLLIAVASLVAEHVLQVYRLLWLQFLGSRAQTQ